MRNQANKTNVIVAAFQIVGLIFSQNIFAADTITLANGHPIAVVDALANSSKSSPVTTASHDPATTFEALGALQPLVVTLGPVHRASKPAAVTAADIAILYKDYLGRDGSKEEIRSWVQSGLSIVEAKKSFLGSQERSNLVASFYKNYLGREASRREIQGWALNDINIRDMKNDFLKCQERHSLVAEYFKTYFGRDGTQAEINSWAFQDKSIQDIRNDILTNAGWTRAASNPNFAFQVRPDASHSNNLLYLLDLRTGSEIYVGGGSLSRHNPSRYDVSPDGRMVVAAYHESGPLVGQLSSIEFYSIAGGNLALQQTIQTANAQSIRFEDGNVIVVAQVRGPNYNGVTGDELKTFTVPTQSVPAGWIRAASNANFAFYVAYSASGDHSLYVMDLNNPKQYFYVGYVTVGAGSDPYLPKAYLYDVSPDGAMVVAALGVGASHEFSEVDFFLMSDLRLGGTGATYIIKTWHNNNTPIVSIGFTSQGSKITMANGDQSIVKFNYSAGKVSEVWDYSYVNGAVSKLYYAAYASNGGFTRSITQNFNANGKAGQSWDYTYTNGVLSGRHYFAYNPNGTLLAQIRRFYYPNGQISKTWNDSYVNGARNVLHYYQYDMNGKLTGWETVKFSLTSGLAVSHTSWYLT